MDAPAAALVLALFYGLPLLHVLLSAGAGPWRAPAGARCPFSPRVGWLVLVLLLGPVGWLLFVTRRCRRAGS
ncbi:MAG: hypothetical protein ACT4N4_18200 [Rhodospirillales bacterium]